MPLLPVWFQLRAPLPAHLLSPYASRKACQAGPVLSDSAPALALVWGPLCRTRSLGNGLAACPGRASACWGVAGPRGWSGHPTDPQAPSPVSAGTALSGPGPWKPPVSKTVPGCRVSLRVCRPQGGDSVQKNEGWTMGTAFNSWCPSQTGGSCSFKARGSGCWLMYSDSTAFLSVYGEGYTRGLEKRGYILGNAVSLAVSYCFC